MSESTSQGGSPANASSHHGEHGHGHGEHGHGGIGKYLLVFLGLCVLTSASFFTVSPLWPFHDTPAVGWTFMMAVSCTKAMLVISFFMHLVWEANWKYVLTIPASIMSIFLVLMLVPDIGQRTENYSGDRWLHAAQPQAPHHVARGHGESGHGESGHGESGHGESGHGGHEHAGDEHAGGAH